MIFLIAGIQGWAKYHLSWAERRCFMASGACLVWPDLMIKGGAVALALALGVFDFTRAKQKAGQPA